VPTFLRWILKYDEVKPDDAVPTLTFPEGASTSGSIGLLKFRCVVKSHVIKFLLKLNS
jgi:hypothetical protein